jgi:hypothetical protein
MALGVYDTDLTLLSNAETTTGWSDLNVGGGGGGALSIEIDFAIQGTSAITRQVSNNQRGAIYNNGVTTLGADDHYWLWTVSATPGITDNRTLGGIVAVIGNNANNYNGYYLAGADTLPQGGIQNYAIHPSAPVGAVNGAGLSGNPSIFGSYISTNNTAKGDNYAIDVIRYGTGFYLTEGDSIYPITFQSASVVNDSNTNRYGILSAVPGGYALKGRFVVGQDPNQVATASYFADDNTAIAFTDTDRSLSDFTQINFDHPSTQAYLNNIIFTGVGSNNPGQINFLNASTTGSIVSCTFNSIGKTDLNANVVVSSSTWNRCFSVFQSGSTIFDSTFVTPPQQFVVVPPAPPSELTAIANSSSLVSDDPSLVTFCTFAGNGSNHGVEITTAGEYNFQSNLFTGFVSGSATGSAVLFNPTGGTGNLILNVLGGVDSPSFNNLSTGTVTINNNIAVTLTGMRDFTEVRVIESGTTVELAGIENVVSASVGADDNDFTFLQPAGTVVDINLVNIRYVIQRISAFEVPNSDTSIPITQQFDRNYSNP